MKRNTRRPNVTVATGGQGVVAHAGARLLCDLADEPGLTGALSEAMAQTKQRRRGHDRGRVLVDLAVAIADGATTPSDLRVLADQPQLFGQVASLATTWRTLEATDAAALDRIAEARASARAAAWSAGMDPGFYVIDLDATLVGAHSEKEGPAPTYKHGFGLAPMVAFLDATGEPLAALLRPGNAAAGSAADHVELLDAALAQLPVDPDRDRGHRPGRFGRVLPWLPRRLFGARRALRGGPSPERRARRHSAQDPQDPLGLDHLGRRHRRA